MEDFKKKPKFEKKPYLSFEELEEEHTGNVKKRKQRKKNKPK